MASAEVLTTSGVFMISLQLWFQGVSSNEVLDAWKELETEISFPRRSAAPLDAGGTIADWSYLGLDSSDLFFGLSTRIHGHLCLELYSNRQGARLWRSFLAAFRIIFSRERRLYPVEAVLIDEEGEGCGPPRTLPPAQGGGQ